MPKPRLSLADRRRKSELIRQIIKHERVGYPPESSTMFQRRQHESLEKLSVAHLEAMLGQAEAHDAQECA